MYLLLSLGKDYTGDERLEIVKIRHIFLPKFFVCFGRCCHEEILIGRAEGDDWGRLVELLLSYP